MVLFWARKAVANDDKNAVATKLIENLEKHGNILAPPAKKMQRASLKI